MLTTTKETILYACSVKLWNKANGLYSSIIRPYNKILNYDFLIKKRGSFYHNFRCRKSKQHSFNMAKTTFTLYQTMTDGFIVESI